MSGSKDFSAVYELRYNPNYVPRQSPSSRIETLSVEGEQSYLLAKEPQGEYYDVDAPTKAIWDLVDGTRTVKEIVSDARKADDKLTDKEVKDVLVSLAEEGTLETTEEQVKKKRVQAVSAFQLDVHLLDDSSKSLAGLFRFTRKLIRREELPVAVAFAALGLALSLSTFVHLYTDPSVLYVADSAIIGFLFYQMLVLLPVYAVHELAHAAVCDYYGGKPKDIGTGLYYLAPFFYCNTTDAWRLPKRARIMICAAGPLSTLVISSALVCWSFFLPAGSVQDVLRIAAFFGYYGSLVNFSPVIETDGYYMLADAVGIPNLRDEAFNYFKGGLLAALRRPARAVRRGKRERRVIGLYSLVAVAWLAFFGYTTFWLMSLYARDAYMSARSLWLTAARAAAFNPATVGVSAATLAYFSLMVAGFCVMGSVASKKIRLKGAKLETIHDKRVSVFLPLPSSMRDGGSVLVDEAKKTARGYSHSYSTALEPPICVCSLNLGRVDESLESTRARMHEIEASFREVHKRFLDQHPLSSQESPAKDLASRAILEFARELPRPERREGLERASDFLKEQDEKASLLLQSAFGTVWTLEMGPDDYKRVKREMLPSLVAEDLMSAGLSNRLEEFKRREVLGAVSLASLSAEVDKESREVSRQSELYQVLVLNEPMKSRLVFVGRTDKVEAAMSWLGGLYLYQAWTSVMDEVLEDAAVGLGSIRLSPSASMTKTLVGKLSGRELAKMAAGMEGLERVLAAATEAAARIASTYESAANFHEGLVSLMDVETYDIGLYKPVLDANARRLEGVGEMLKQFRTELSRLSKRASAGRELLEEERRIREQAPAPRGGLVRGLLKSITGSGRRGESTAAYETQVRLALATLRLLYQVVAFGDIAQ